MNRVDPKLPLDVVVTSDAKSIDFERLVEFSDRAWRHDYSKQLRVLYDRDYFTWLLNGNHWFAVLALTETGEPVGCFFSLLRSLRYQGEFFPLAYSTGWAVDPAYRRTGISMRLWQKHRATLLERGYVGMSTSHAGHSTTRIDAILRNPAGQPSGVSIAFHTGSIWSRRLSAKLVAKRDSRILMQQLCCCDGVAAGERLDHTVNDQRFAALTATTSSLCFDPSNNFAQLYMNSACSRSGTMWFDFKNGSRCAVGFSTHTLAYDDMTIGLIGRIQFFLSQGCDDHDVVAALGSICSFLKELGCVSASLVDQRCITHEVLAESGFAKTPDEVTFYLWAPDDLAARFKDVRPPCALDFL